LEGFPETVSRSEENGIDSRWVDEGMLIALAGWDGPNCISERIFRYSKCISWIRLYIQAEGSEFYGGISGSGSDFELAREGSRWIRYPSQPAWTAAGEPVLILRGCSTLDAVYERAAEGEEVCKTLASIEELAAFLERSVL
jgi:hypothetical protein